MIITQFLDHLAMREMSPKTIKRRRTTLRSLERWLDPMPIIDADAERLEEWLATFASPRTRHAYRSDCAAFFGWALKRKLVAANPMADVGTIRVPKGLPRPVPAEMVPTIIATAEGLTLQTALALAAYAGLRREEIVNLRPEDVSYTEGVIVVRCGKGSKDRVVPLHPTLAAMLQRHRGHAPFVPLSPNWLGHLASRHLQALGLDNTLHHLRATFATQLAHQTNGNLLLVGEMLGHESLNTTRGYCKLAGSEQGQDAVRRLYAVARNASDPHRPKPMGVAWFVAQGEAASSRRSCSTGGASGG